MSKNAKRIAICLLIAVILTILILLIPSLFLKSIPTVQPVKVAKIDYTDSVTADGIIIVETERNLISVTAYIPEKEIGKVLPGQAVQVTGDAFPDETYSGRIAGIADEAERITVGNTTKTMVAVVAQIIDADDKLKNGYSATIKIITGRTQNKRLLPYDAVEQDDGGEFIYVLKGSTAVKKYIITGSELPEGIEVLYGLDENEEVIKVSEGVNDGATVSVEEVSNDKQGE